MNKASKLYKCRDTTAVLIHYLNWRNEYRVVLTSTSRCESLPSLGVMTMVINPFSTELYRETRRPLSQRRLSDVENNTQIVNDQSNVKEFITNCVVGAVTAHVVWLRGALYIRRYWEPSFSFILIRYWKWEVMEACWCIYVSLNCVFNSSDNCQMTLNQLKITYYHLEP